MAVVHHAPIILASGSTIRQQMLKAVGLTFSVEPSGLDEEALVATVQHLPVAERALTLARAKAMAVSKKHPNAFVIGADQMCCIDGDVLNKPETYPNAQAQLARLSGRTHEQNCGCAIVRASEVLWESASTAKLTMRQLTDAEIRNYLAADAPLQSAGSYKFEALGRHLFTHAEGDHDVVKGLPLLALLNALHAHGAIALAA